MPAPRASAVLALPCLLLAAAACMVRAGTGTPVDATVDHWQVRTTGTGHARRVESISTINTAGATRAAALSATPLIERTAGDATVAIHADAAARAALPADLQLVERELARAVDWLDRLVPPGDPRARIVLTLVGDGRRLVLRRVHAGRTATTIDIAAPLDPAAANAPSAQLGRALATALHEASHATAQGRTPALSRADDEYRASLVESCYLVDTLRPGDRLALPDRPPPTTGEAWTAAASRDASARVVEEFARAAGGRSIAWNDRTALLGVKLLCRARLALRPTASG